MAAFVTVPSLQFKAPGPFRTPSNPFSHLPFQYKNLSLKPLVIEARSRARAKARKESAKVRNRRLQRKFNGTSARPRLSVFCSTKQLYAMLVDDQNKKCIFFGSTLQKSIRDAPACGTIRIMKFICCDQSKRKKAFLALMAFTTFLQVLHSYCVNSSMLKPNEAAKRVGEALVKACIDLNINEISSYDHNGFSRGEKMQAFEIAISQHGFLPW